MDELTLCVDNEPGFIYWLEKVLYNYFGEKRARGSYDTKKAVITIRNNYVRPAIRYYKRMNKGTDVEMYPQFNLWALTEADENQIARYYRDRLINESDLRKIKKGSRFVPKKLADYELREIARVRR